MTKKITKIIHQNTEYGVWWLAIPVSVEDTAENTTYDNTESWLNATNVQDALDEINEKIEIIQYSIIPTAVSENVGKIIQYTGTTTQTYTNGYFYKCVSDGQDPETFSREQVNVQPGWSAWNYLEKVTIMPAVVEETALNTTLMYVGNDTDKYKAGHIYTVKIKEIEEHFFWMGYSSASYVLAKKSTLSVWDTCWYLYDNQGWTPSEYYLPDVVVQSQTDNNLYPSAKLDDSNYKIADDYQGGYTSSYFKDFYENIDLEESLNAKLDVKDGMPVFQVSDYNNNTTFVLRNHQSGDKLTRWATYTVGITEDVVPNDFTYYVSSSWEYFDYYFNKANPTIWDTCYVRHAGWEALLKCKLVAFGDDRVIADWFETDSDAELYTPVTPYDQEYIPDGRVYGWVEVGKEKGAVMFKDFPYAYFMEDNGTRLSLQTYLWQVKAGHLYQKDTKTLSNIYAYNNWNYYTDTSTPTDDTHVYIKVWQSFSQIPARIKNNTIYWAYGLQIGASRSSSKDETDAYVYYYTDVTETPTASTTSYDNTTSGLSATNMQDAIDEVFQSVSNGKELIADAITDKGVSTSASDSFQTMAENIESLNVGGKYMSNSWGDVILFQTYRNNPTWPDYTQIDYTTYWDAYFWFVWSSWSNSGKVAWTLYKYGNDKIETYSISANDNFVLTWFKIVYNDNKIYYITNSHCIYYDLTNSTFNTWEQPSTYTELTLTSKSFWYWQSWSEYMGFWIKNLWNTWRVLCVWIYESDAYGIETRYNTTILGAII